MKVKVNGKYSHNLEVVKHEVKLDEVAVDFDYLPLRNLHSHVIYKHKSYSVEIIEENRSTKNFVLKVNGTTYHVDIADQYDELLKQLGMDYAKSNKVADVKAPMPGMVLNILVERDQEVKKGQNLLVLEAMKMENMIKAPADGIVKNILISTGDKIEKNTVMIQFG
jgi:biotin carboxyl carrier protein